MKLLEPHTDIIRMQDILRPEAPNTRPLNIKICQQRLGDVSSDVLMSNACTSRGSFAMTLHHPYDFSVITPIVLVDEDE